MGPAQATFSPNPPAHPSLPTPRAASAPASGAAAGPRLSGTYPEEAGSTSGSLAGVGGAARPGPMPCLAALGSLRPPPPGAADDDNAGALPGSGCARSSASRCARSICGRPGGRAAGGGGAAVVGAAWRVGWSTGRMGLQHQTASSREGATPDLGQGWVAAKLQQSLQPCRWGASPPHPHMAAAGCQPRSHRHARIPTARAWLGAPLLHGIVARAAHQPPPRPPPSLPSPPHPSLSPHPERPLLGRLPGHRLVRGCRRRRRPGVGAWHQRRRRRGAPHGRPQHAAWRRQHVPSPGPAPPRQRRCQACGQLRHERHRLALRSRCSGRTLGLDGLLQLAVGHRVRRGRGSRVERPVGGSSLQGRGWGVQVAVVGGGGA